MNNPQPALSPIPPTNDQQQTTNKKPFFCHESSYVDDGAVVGAGSKIWHFSHVLSGAVIGEHCNLGQNVSIAGDVKIGDNVKIQNNVSVYAGAEIEDDVFLGPSCVLTNVTNPRSQINRHSLYEKTLIRRGETIGANATIVCGVTLGRYAFVAAGAVVTHDVPDYGFVVGSPARQVGWMSRHGHKLEFDESNTAICPESGYRYQVSGVGCQVSGEEGAPTVTCISIGEDEPLPPEHSAGSKSYRELKQ